MPRRHGGGERTAWSRRESWARAIRPDPAFVKRSRPLRSLCHADVTGFSWVGKCRHQDTAHPKNANDANSRLPGTSTARNLEVPGRRQSGLDRFFLDLVL